MSADGFDPLQPARRVPAPVDDGAADHLTGLRMPAVALVATNGAMIQVDRVPDGFTRLVLYVYPKIGRPDSVASPSWYTTPGAAGCSQESCGFRDHVTDLAAAGTAIAGVSTQGTSSQVEAARRLRLPFPLLSDARRELATALALPTLSVDGTLLLRRLTLVIRAGHIEHVFYPVHPPGTHAEQVLRWISVASRREAF